MDSHGGEWRVRGREVRNWISGGGGSVCTVARLVECYWIREPSSFNPAQPQTLPPLKLLLKKSKLINFPIYN